MSKNRESFVPRVKPLFRKNLMTTYQEAGNMTHRGDVLFVVCFFRVLGCSSRIKAQCGGKFSAKGQMRGSTLCKLRLEP
ncbi:unnamed protein product [Larinioides sclopetarius]|uniref:Uncharacterized protein n=1 Tax=Larinioides sclopetarius TaxID=280406 RepID=A0AAV1ZZP4_9ARAC